MPVYLQNKRFKKRRLNATQTIVLSFLLIIITGGLLLMLPAATQSGQSAPPETAFFTSVSATCVTGLVIEDTSSYWTLFGQTVILCLIQIGGLGFMTVAMMMSVIVRRRVTPRDQQIIAQSLNLTSYENIGALTRRVMAGTFIIEGAGAALLSIRFIPLYGAAAGIYRSIFHSVSAFCNAGFDLFGKQYGAFTSLEHFAEDPLVVLTICALIVTGGIGFIVWDEVYNYVKSRRRMSVYVRFVLVVTGALLALSFLAVGVAEWNSGSFGDSGVGGKLLKTIFQGVTPRTAGFATIDLTKMRDITQLIFLLLMFIGGASGSTAGGVKVSTFALVIYAVYCVALGKKNVVLWKRKVSTATVLRALSLVVIQFIITFIGVAVMLMEGAELMPAMFEAFSATGTVGLSLSLTPALGTASHIALMFMMFFGRVGILSVTFAIMQKQSDANSPIDYAETNILIG